MSLCPASITRSNTNFRIAACKGALRRAGTTAALFVEYHGMRADEAAEAAVEYLVSKVHGLGGLIIVDYNGVCARAHSTPGMVSATAENGEVHVQIS